MFDKKRRAARRAIYAEAKRRGVPVQQLGELLSLKELADVVEGSEAQPDFARWGLPPREALVDTPSSGVPAVDDAAAAAANGEWRPAATLLAETDGEWHLQACAVTALGLVAADDDNWLTAWRAAEPETASTLAVDCAARVALAWQLRGTKIGADTTAKQADDFHRVLVDAQEVAERAVTASPDDPTSWATMLTIARGLGVSHDVFLGVWRRLAERAPLHRRAHESALQYWCAKWCGSHDNMLGFAQEAVERSPSLSVMMLQAAYELSFDDAKAWQRNEVRVALDRHLYWLTNDGAHGVDLRDDLGWAALALVETGRGAEAVELFRRLGTDAGGMPWRLTGIPAMNFNDYRIRACEGAA